MKKLNVETVKKLTSKAKRSCCRFKISAIGFDKKGNYVGRATNSKISSVKLFKRGVGVHAEMALMKRYGTKLKSIVICRVGNSGLLRPIEPCEVCSTCARKLNIKIYSLKP